MKLLFILAKSRPGLQRILLLNVLLFSGLTALHATPADLYVNFSAGSDTNTGLTSGSAFKTLAHAQSYIRTNVIAVSGHMTQNLTVHITGVPSSTDPTQYTAFLTASLSFTSADSSNNGYTITYNGENTGGAFPRISGGYLLPSSTVWSKYSTTGIMCATFNPSALAGGNVLVFRQLVVNNLRATRARWPKAGTSASSELHMTYWDTANSEIHVGSAMASPTPPITADASQGTIEVVVGKSYAEARGNLRSWNGNLTDGTFGFGTTQWSEMSSTEPPCKSNQPFHLENSFNFMYNSNTGTVIAVPGEWYFDHAGVFGAANTLYYYPRSGEFTGTTCNVPVVIPTVNQLVTLVGTRSGTAVTGLKFTNLIFQDTAWNDPSPGWNSANTTTAGGYFGASGPISLNNLNYFYPDPPNFDQAMPSAVFLDAAGGTTSASGILFQGCTFARLGANAITLNTTCNHVSILGNIITDVCGSGIVADYNPVTSESSPITEYETSGTPNAISVQNTDIENNYISDVGVDYYNAAAIYGTYPNNTTIEHNEICYCPSAGIQIGYMPTGGAPTDLGGTMIEYNNIHHVMQRLTDVAGIYICEDQKGDNASGTTETYNYIHDLVRAPWVIDGIVREGGDSVAAYYLDEGTQNATVSNNVCVAVDKFEEYNATMPPSSVNNVDSPNNVYNQATINSCGLQSSYASLSGSAATFTSLNQSINPVGWWQFTTGTGITSWLQDFSSYGVTASNSGASNTSDGVNAAGMTTGGMLPGASGYVSVSSSSGLATIGTKGAFTISAWIRLNGYTWPASTDGNYNIVAAGTSIVLGTVGTTNNIGISVNGGSKVLSYVENGNTGSQGSGAPATSKWIHVAATYDGSTLNLYRNGVWQKSVAWTGTLSPPSTWTIGQGFPGEIDDVRIYNAALSYSNIQTLSGIYIDPTLLTRWSLADQNLFLIDDETGNNNKGIVMENLDGSGYLLALSPVTSTSSKNGLRFDSNSGQGYIDLRLPALKTTLYSNLTGSFTFSAWVYADHTFNQMDVNLGAPADIFSDVDAAYGYQFGSVAGAANYSYIGAQYYNTLGAAETADEDDTTITTWYHLCAVYDSSAGTLKIYKNGILQTTATGIPSTAISVSTADLFIGENLQGSLSDVRIYDRPLSASEVTNLVY